MYKLVANPNRVLIVLALSAGLAAVFYFPPLYPNKIVEIPLMVIFVGEIGLALFSSLLFYENANFHQVLKLTCSILGFALLIGAVGNWSGQLTQMLPDSFVLLSWVQLIIMNTAGILSTLSIYRLQLAEEPQALRARLAEPVVVQPAAGRPEGSRTRTVDNSPEAPPSHDFSPPAEATKEAAPAEPKRLQSVKEILEGLDISRIMRLERSIHPAEPTSLENLFKEENRAAEAAAAKEPGSGVIVTPASPGAAGELKSMDFSPCLIGLGTTSGLQETQPLPEQSPAATETPATEDQNKDQSDVATEKDLSRLAKPASPSMSSASLAADSEVSSAPDSEAGQEAMPLSSAPTVQPDAMIPPQAAVTPDEEAIPLSEAPSSTADEAIPLGEAPSASADEAIPLGEAPSASTNELISSGEAPAAGTADPTALLESPVTSGKEGIALPDAPVASEEVIPLADSPALQAVSEPDLAQKSSVNSHMPSLQELLKTEIMTGPLAPLEDLPSDLIVPPDTIAQAERAPETTDSNEAIYDDEAVAVELDEAFKKLVPREALRNVSSETLAQLRESQAAGKREPDLSDDFPISPDAGADRSVASSEIADLIKSLAEEEEELSLEKPAKAQKAGTPKANEPKEVKDFGRLSAKASAKPEAAPDTGGGMKTIGKMLIDAQAVENIIKQGEKRSGGMTTARIVSVRRGEAIKSLLSYIDKFPGVTGSLIIGNDGLVICSTVDPALDKDLLGAMSLAIQSNSDIASGKLNLGGLREIVLQSDDRLTLLKKLDDGILAVFSDTPQPGRVDGLLKLLSSLMRGKSEKGDSEEHRESAAAEKTTSPATEPVRPGSQPAHTATSSGQSVPARPEPPPVARLTESSSLQSPSQASPEQSISPKQAEEARPSASPAPDNQSARVPVAADLVRDLIASLSRREPDRTSETGPSAAPACDPKTVAAPDPSPAARAPSSAPKPPSPATPVPPTTAKPPSPAASAPSSAPKEAAAPAAASTQAEAAAQIPPETKDSALARDAAQLNDDAPARQAAQSQTVKEFGRLSSSSGAYPQASDSQQQGTMSIGKMLLDVQAVTNIIKSAEKRSTGLTTARVISAARGEGIRSLLSRIDTYPGVAGSLIVGHDGLVIASTLSPAMDKDTLGAMATSIHSHTNVTTTKLELGKLHQMVMQSQDRITILTNVEVGVLAVFCEYRELDKLDGLLEAIDATVQS